MTARIEPIDFHGLPAIALHTAGGARAVVARHGAQLLSWVPAGGTEWLYLSPKAVFDGSTAIRGGIPVCFPQFAEQGKLPKHGFARTREWQVDEQRTGDDFALLTLTLADDDATQALWPQPFASEVTVVLENDRIDIELEVTNTGHAPFAFTAALHTYLRVAEVETARLEGLYGHEFRDTADNGAVKRETGEALVVDREIDRLYQDVQRPLLLRDGARSLGIQAEGFPDVVVWNPWEARCAELTDMPADGFRRMLCVEAAAAHQRVQLDAGSEWFGRQSLVVL